MITKPTKLAHDSGRDKARDEMRQLPTDSQHRPRWSGETFVMDAAPSQSLFGRAIDEFLVGLAIKEITDNKNPFIKELLARQSEAMGSKDAAYQMNTSAGELQAFMSELETQRHSGRYYRVLQRLGPFLESLKSLLRLGESFGQISPMGVGAAFSGARIVLELAISHHTYFDIIVEAMEQIGDCLTCYQKFGEAFESSPDFQVRLVKSYKRVIQFWYSVSQNLSQRKLVFKSITVSLIGDTKDALDGLKEDCRHIQGLAQATESLQARRAREEDIRQDIRSWIMGGFGHVDVRIDQQRESRRRQDGTCTWLLEDPRFAHWRDNTKGNSVLWYNAAPGTGKTVMASAIVEHLSQRGDSVAWWYFSFNNPKQRQSLSGLRSLALQLLTILDYVPDELETVFRQELRQNAIHLESLAVAAVAMHRLMNQCGHVHIVIDGIDECFDDGNLLAILPDLIKQETRGLVKWLFTSRDYANIRQQMEAVGAVEIVPDMDAVLKDVQAYFTANLSPGGGITKYTEGEDNFLYAKYICETLRGEGFTCDAEIREALDKFPKDLTTYYTRALEKITLQTEEKQELARRVFVLVVGTLQPITLDEAIDALAVRPGARDYDPATRLLRIKLIQELCAPLLVIDSPDEGTKTRVLKLHHKTVEDFFLQDPESLKVGHHLRKFFKNRQEINTELGLQCLTYLSYQRYTKPCDLDKILNECPEEHAFLRYAATFWFQHLLSTSHKPNAEVVAATKLFLKSKALWTCLEVQGRVSPYLFGRYASLRRRGSYRIGIRGPGWSGDDCFGVPLPQWLDQHSTEMRLLDRSLCCFLDEWREVLVTSPGGLSACLPLTKVASGCHLTPISKPRTLKVEHLDERLNMGSVAQISQIQVTPGKPLWATILYRAKNGPSNEYTRLQVPLFSAKLKATQSTHLLPIDAYDAEESVELIECIDGNKVSLEAWSIDQDALALRRTTEATSELVKLPPSMHRAMFLGEKKGQELFMEPVTCSAIRTTIKVFRVVWRSRRLTPLENASRSNDTLGSSDGIPNSNEASDDDDDDDDDSNDDDDDDDDDDDNNYDNDDEDEDSDNKYDDSVGQRESLNDDNSDDDSSSTRSQDVSEDGNSDRNSTTSVEESSENGPCTDTLMILAPGQHPHWLNGWASQTSRWENINTAVHPFLPIVAVTHTAFKLEILNLDTGKQETRNLPELADLQERPGASTRELRFSSCGNYLHFLLVWFVDEGRGTKCHVKLSTFHFNNEGNNDDTLVRGSRARTCTYWIWERAGNIAAPLALTCWHDDVVVVALPPLTCDPQILKIPLPRGEDVCETTGTIEDDDGAAILSLVERIYFPSTTPRRSHQLIYRPGMNGDDDYIYLSLGPLLMMPTSDLTDINCAKPPVVLRWKVSGKGGWQACGAEMKQASRPNQEMSLMSRLRGTYTDGNRSFGVPIRGGLNWSRKGFLSCG